MPQEHNRGEGGPRHVRIAIDIDSTLHHYWDELADSAKRRFGVELPYGDDAWQVVDLWPAAGDPRIGIDCMQAPSWPSNAR